RHPPNLEQTRCHPVTEGGVPSLPEKRELATHGCIHVEPPHIEWLYDWAEEGATAVVISGERSGD
ncbi:MAG: L,D-transpeptidase, partial [Syntrophobacterales bacterium]